MIISTLSRLLYIHIYTYIYLYIYVRSLRKEEKFLYAMINSDCMTQLGSDLGPLGPAAKRPPCPR